MIAIFVFVPNSSLAGHFCGILAGLALKFCGLHIFLPHFKWISAFDHAYAKRLQEKISYYEAQERIKTDFGFILCRKIGRKLGLKNSKLGKYCCCMGDEEMAGEESEMQRMQGGGYRVGSSEGFRIVPS